MNLWNDIKCGECGKVIARIENMLWVAVSDLDFYCPNHGDWKEDNKK